MSLIANGVFASSPRVTRGAPTVLKGDPKGKNFLYTNGLSVFIRDIENPTLCDVYTQHAKEVRVACYAPSGFYIASGDISGKIRIWDTTQQEHLLKYEYQPISGEVRDIAWSPDSKRMVVVGNGGDKFGSVFLWDTGSSVGSITGHSKMINSVDYKPTRPFGICTASEDKAVGFHKGPPFKLERINQGEEGHKNFVNVVRYAPDGSYFVSGGADGKCHMYDGKTGEMKHSVGGEAGAHKGSVYGLSWSADSKFLLSASADKTCKLWDVEANSVVTEFAMGQDLESQQLGCLWQGDHLLSLSLSGHINYLDKNNPSTPLRVIKGHSKNITALAISEDHTKVYSGSFDARICSWDVKTGQAEQFKGTGHSSQVTDMKVSGNCLVSCGMDDTVRFTTLDSEEYSSEFIKMDSQPRAVAVGKDGLVIVPCINEIVVIRDGKKVSSLNVVYEPCSAAVHPNQTEVAVGGGNDERIHIFKLENDKLVEKTTLKTRGTVYDLAYSPEGEFLASGDGNRRVFVFDTKDEWKVKEEWSSQTARVNTLAWTSDSKHIASSGLSTNITINHVGQTIRTWEKRACHPQSVITRLLWIDDNTLISAGHDCCLRLWKIEQ